MALFNGAGRSEGQEGPIFRRALNNGLKWHSFGLKRLFLLLVPAPLLLSMGEMRGITYLRSCDCIKMCLTVHFLFVIDSHVTFCPQGQVIKMTSSLCDGKVTSSIASSMISSMTSSVASAFSAVQAGLGFLGSVGSKSAKKQVRVTRDERSTIVESVPTDC